MKVNLAHTVLHQIHTNAHDCVQLNQLVNPVNNYIQSASLTNHNVHCIIHHQCCSSLILKKIPGHFSDENF